MIVNIHPQILQLFLQLLKQSSRTSGRNVIRLQPQISGGLSPEWVRSELDKMVREFIPKKAPPKKSRSVPLFLRTPASYPSVAFALPDISWERQTNIPFPSIAISPRIGTKLREAYTMPNARPDYYMTFNPPTTRAGKWPEENRRRHDQKIPRQLKQAYSLVGRTYGRYTEWQEVNLAFAQNWPNLDAVVNALAINEAIDQMAGRTAKSVKRNIYDKDWYKLPIGLQLAKNLPNYALWQDFR